MGFVIFEVSVSKTGLYMKDFDGSWRGFMKSEVMSDVDRCVDRLWVLFDKYLCVCVFSFIGSYNELFVILCLWWFHHGFVSHHQVVRHFYWGLHHWSKQFGPFVLRLTYIFVCVPWGNFFTFVFVRFSCKKVCKEWGFMHFNRERSLNLNIRLSFISPRYYTVEFLILSIR